MGRDTEMESSLAAAVTSGTSDLRKSLPKNRPRPEPDDEVDLEVDMDEVEVAPRERVEALLGFVAFMDMDETTDSVDPCRVSCSIASIPA